RETLAQDLNGIRSGELRGLLPALRTAQQHRNVGVLVRDNARVLHVPRAQLHHRAAAGANRRFDEPHLPVSDQPLIEAVGQPVHVPHDDPEPATRGDVGRDTEADGGDGEWHDDLQALALPVPETLTVTPRRQLDAWRLADAHEVVALPADQRDLLGGRGDAALQRGTRDGFDAFEAIVKRGEIPATTPRANDPEPSLPLIERDAATDTEARGPAISVKCGVTEGTTAKHPRK